MLLIRTIEGYAKLALAHDVSLPPCSVFYDGTLQNAVSEAERKMKGLESLWPTADKPVFFWCHSGQEEISSSGTSYLNRSV